MFSSIKRILHTLGRTFMPHLYDLNPQLKKEPVATVEKKAAPKKAAVKKGRPKKK